MVAQKLPVIAHEKDNRVLQLPGLRQRGNHPSNALVDVLDHRVVGGRDLALVGIGHGRDIVAIGIVVGLLTVELLVGGLVLQLTGPALGQRHVIGIVPRQVICRWIKGVMWRKTVVAEEPRLALLLADEINGHVGAPCGLVVLGRDAVFYIRRAGAIVKFLPCLTPLGKPLGISVLGPVRLRMM